MCSMLDDQRKKELANLCNPKEQVWNPFGEFSDRGVEKRVAQTDSLTRFIRSCSVDVRGQELLDPATGKYVKYSGGKNQGPAQEPASHPSDIDRIPRHYDL